MIPLTLAALKVMILAGGDTAQTNYHAHKTHVERLYGRLQAQGVPPEDVAIFWADGEDPAPDRAVRREADVEGAWLIEGTPVDEATVTPLSLEQTQIEGATLRPARRAEIQGWLKTIGPTLGPEDTLLIAVTDHGVPDPEGGGEAGVSLWGETWTVSQAAADLAPTAGAGRVVVWMSQCHSGGFEALKDQQGNLCGAFSTTADRVAYGCYPDLAQRTDVGHFLRLLEGLGAHGRLDWANDYALISDDTPDIPHLTSDALLWQALSAAAEAQERSLAEVADRAPGPSPLVAEIAGAYSLGPVETYAALERRLIQLDELIYALGAWLERWQEPLAVIRAEAAAPWAERFIAGARRAKSAQQRRRLRVGAVALARAEIATDPRWWRRARAVYGRVTQGEALWSALDLKEAAALRVAYLHARRGGPPLLDAEGRRRWAALRRCESTPLWPKSEGPPAQIRPPKMGGTLDALSRQVAALRPAYIGARFTPAEVEAIPGAVQVEEVEPGGPAARGGLRAGDVITAIGGAPLRQGESFLSGLMLSPPGAPRPLTVRRGPETLQLSAELAQAPLPPRPLNLGDTLPPLSLRPVQGEPPKIGAGRGVVLFFWATWCRPCKAALPALASWAKDHGVEVLAITSEDPEVARRFLQRFPTWPGFPVASDPSGAIHALLQVQSTPVFIRVSPGGIIIDGGEGYDGALPLKE